MSSAKNVISSIVKGQSVLRAFLNQRLQAETLRGHTIDVGSGADAAYLAFMSKTDDCQVVPFDVKSGEQIDFETDQLPAEDGAYDTVLFLNVMEHIYNYQHIANEVMRITKPGGQLIGFVPFLMWYHADYRDFFRYTHEALENILMTAGAKNPQVEMIGAGPFLAAAHMILQSFPRLLRPLIFVPFWCLDWLYMTIKGDEARPYALGYFFKVEK